jgi:type II secretory pathway pseudopilin PulG
MMVAMAEGTNKSTPKEEDAARKRMRRSGSLQRTQQRKAWTRRDLGGMTLRNWLPIAGILLVSLVIALGIWGITWQLEKLENQRAEAERELAERRAQDEALQAYLDQMSQLILDRKLLEVEQGDPVHTLAQARTSTAILRLDAKHNESVTHFLNAWCELGTHHPIRSANFRRGRPSCSLSQMQKLCRATLAANLPRNPSSS